MSARPPLRADMPYEEEFALHRAELWTPAGARNWQQRRRSAAAWLVAYKEAGEELTQRTEDRIVRDELRLKS
jgi:hypothetical protein